MTKSFLAIRFGAEKTRPVRRSFERIGHPSIFQPGVRSAYLDTGRGGGVSADVAILSLGGANCNGTVGLELGAAVQVGWKDKQTTHPLLILGSEVTPIHCSPV